MRVFFFIIFSFLLLSCADQNSNPFIIKSSLNSSQKFEQCLKFEDGFVVVTERNKLFFLNSNFEVDTLLTKKIQPKSNPNFYDIYKGILLMSATNEEGTHSYRLAKNKKWVLTKKEDFSDIFFEDDTYVISAQCKGEFGGTVFFKHKKTQKIYSCLATCLISVNKLNNVYYLTIALGHLGQSSKLIIVKDPTVLFELKKEIKPKNNWWINENVNRDDLMKGTEKVIDTFGLLIHDSFVIKDKLYHINETGISNSSYGQSMGNILLSTVKDNKLVTIDTIHAGSVSLGTTQKTEEFSFLHFNYYDNQKILIVIQKDSIEVVTINLETY